jgi:predicted O-methyltransferase YrrM
MIRSEHVQRYLDGLRPRRDDVLAEMEALAQRDGIPIVEWETGRLLATLVRALAPAQVVEVGTAIGYSTLWLALGLDRGRRIVTIDPDRDRTDRARGFWRAAGIEDARIEVVNAPALDAFAEGPAILDGPFDLAFIDAHKAEYPAYLAAIRPRLAPGALLVADNVLWGGRASGDRPSRPDDGTEALRSFVTQVLRDAAFEGTVLPIGDGLLVAAFRG